ncbi:MAG: phytanoyl-CoA dioxygenase family protein [Candidatus Latescibacterota bacterium]|nr:phytanoyl-CoA dioxygenase family protein [Candidatus Latescibacterota bacterium]
MSEEHPVFNDEDLAFWDQQGYVVLPNAVPQDHLDTVIDEIWTFLGMDRDDPGACYREPHRVGGMVEMYQTQGLWNNRQHPRVHRAFTQLWGTPWLWVTMDRVNMKPPVREDKPEWDHEGRIHWDMDTSRRPFRFGMQGVLYLSDTEENQGTFQCVPGFHRQFEDWVRTQPPDRDPHRPDLEGLEVKKIAGKAGDLLIWQRLLPHGNSRNTSDRPRLAQYITMLPAPQEPGEVGEERVKMWRDRLHPPGKAFPGDSRRYEQKHNEPADLTPLGRKLLGIDAWS